MGTRSIIGFEEDGKITAAYCHWDGYLENNGDILYKEYKNPAKIKKLISFGDMSSLGAEIEPPEGASHSFNDPAKDVTVYYNRDRGETDVSFREYNSREEMFDQEWDSEYFYLWVDNHWIYSERDHKWHDLGEAIEQIDAEAAS